MHENISGIYNYCDRWCEKCAYTTRCLLFKQEAEREIKHILQDEDKNDPDILAKDLAEDFKEAFDHIKKFMDEEDEEYEEFRKEDFRPDEDDDSDVHNEGFLEEDIDDDERPSTYLRNTENALILHSQKMYKDFYKSYDQISSAITTNTPEDCSLNNLRNSLDILGWYTPQIHVKIKMSYWNKHQLSRATDPEMAEIDREMLNVSSRIAFVGIENCITALKDLQQKNIEPLITIASLLTTTKQIQGLFEEEFPDASGYKRPYFD